MRDYAKTLVEVDEILKQMNQRDLQKIPKDVLVAIEENKDKNYSWQYDLAKPLQDQNITRDTVAMLSYLNIQYLLNEKQKKFMMKIHKLNQKMKNGKV